MTHARPSWPSESSPSRSPSRSRCDDHPDGDSRTFNFNSAGSMVQQPLPPQWGWVILRAPSGEKFHRQDHSAR